MPKKIKITLELTEEQWAEIPYALETKALAVEAGDYGRGKCCEKDNKKWIKTLKTAQRIIEKALTKNKVTW